MTKPKYDFSTSLQEPSRATYGRWQDAYERDKSAWRQENDIDVYMGYYAEMTDEHIAAMPLESQAFAIQQRASARELAESYEKLRTIPADPEREAASKAAWAAIWDRLQGDTGRAIAAEREAGRGYRATYTASKPHSTRLARVRKNLKTVVASIERYEKKLADIAAAKVTLAAPRPKGARFEDLGDLAVLAGEKGYRENDELRQLRPKRAHWEAEVDRLEPLALAERQQAKSAKRAG